MEFTKEDIQELGIAVATFTAIVLLSKKPWKKDIRKTRPTKGKNLPGRNCLAGRLSLA